jgi:uncharacterized YigZ family protein
MTVHNDQFNTISAPVTAELKEKGSKFICQAQPCPGRQEAVQVVTNIEKKYFDASHHPFAYRLNSSPTEISHASDDGEPSGTAGRPILQAITTRELTNIVVVVTRYFGGTKLGTGGLIRAYGGVTAAALAKATLKTVYLKESIVCKYSYDMTPIVMNALEKFNGEMTLSRYDVDVTATISVRSSRSAEFQAFLIERSSGNILVRQCGSATEE